jgi:hypothetical protein
VVAANDDAVYLFLKRLSALMPWFVREAAVEGEVMTLTEGRCHAPATIHSYIRHQSHFPLVLTLAFFFIAHSRLAVE